MIVLKGVVQKGVGHFQIRISKYRAIFKKATGEDLFPGTLNVNVGRKIEIVEHFRIKGSDIGEPDQDLLFERCLINGIKAYRIRPFHFPSRGGGGHGDHILEIAASKKIENVGHGTVVEITLFRNSLPKGEINSVGQG